MGRAMEVLSGRITNQAAFTAWTMNTGDSLAIRSFPFDSGKALLEDAWALSATAGTLRVRSPRLHDNVQGIRMGIAASDPRPLLPDWFEQPLYPQDALIVEQLGGGAETDVASLFLYYENVPGVNARLADWPSVQAVMRNLLTVEVSPISSATAGDYGAGRAINADFDLLKANVDYAVLGYITPASVCTVGIRSVDFGNLRVGGPGHIQRDETRDWFVRQSIFSGRPMIPIFNAANKGATLVDVTDTAVSTTRTVQIILAELSGSPT